MIRCTPELLIPHNIRGTMANLDNHMTAREVVQIFTTTEGYEEIPKPKKCDQKSPERPNAYTDGSMLNTKALHWAIGGLGVWWPGRKNGPTEAEKAVAHSEQEEKGLMLCAVLII